MWRMRFLVLLCLCLVLLPGVLFADEWVKVKQSELDELITIIENLESNRQILQGQLIEQESLLKEQKTSIDELRKMLETARLQSKQWETMYVELGTSWQIYKNETERELRTKRTIIQGLILAIPVGVLTGIYIGTRF